MSLLATEAQAAASAKKAYLAAQMAAVKYIATSVQGTAGGIAATADGETFAVVASDGSEAVLYRNVGGTATALGFALVGKDVVESFLAELDTAKDAAILEVQTEGGEQVALAAGSAGAAAASAASIPSSSSINLWDDALFRGLFAANPTAATSMFLEDAVNPRVFNYNGTPGLAWDASLSPLGNPALTTAAGNSIDLVTRFAYRAFKRPGNVAGSIILHIPSGTTATVTLFKRTTSTSQGNATAVTVTGNGTAQEVALGTFSVDASTDRILIRVARGTGTGAITVCGCGLFAGTMARPISEDDGTKYEVRALDARVDDAEEALSGWTPISGLTTVDDAYFTRTTGAIVTGVSGFQYTVVEVEPGDRIRVDQARLNGAGIALASYHTSSTSMGTGTYISRQYDGTTDNIIIGTNAEPYTLTIPANCRAIGITGRDDTAFIITKLTLQTDLAERVAAIENGTQTSSFSGMPWASFGDSITGQGRWQTQLISAIGLGAHTNCGVSGSTVSSGGVSPSNPMHTDTRIDAIPLGSKLIAFMGGTNDMGQSAPLGAITAMGATSFDTATYYGALETVATKLLARFNAGQMIVWMAPPLGRWDARAAGGWPDAYTNAAVLRIEDYNAALKAVAAKYGFPCIDLREMLGWNSVNIAQYLDAESNLLHPSVAVGGPRMAAVIANYMQSNLSRTAAIVNA